MRIPSSRIIDDGREALAEARRLMFTARAAPVTEGEAYARQALHRFRAAMDRLEDTPEFEVAHAELDVAGRFCRENWPKGCELVPVGRDFSQECPAWHAHTRVGFSPAMLANAICSVCGVDVTTCPHLPGEPLSDVVAALVGDGWCSIDGHTECTEHELGRTYDARVAILITHVHSIEEVSIVGRPAQPDARIMKVTMPRSDFDGLMGGPLPDGVIPVCDRCLNECPGVHDPYVES